MSTVPTSLIRKLKFLTREELEQLDHFIGELRSDLDATIGAQESQESDDLLALEALAGGAAGLATGTPGIDSLLGGALSGRLDALSAGEPADEPWIDWLRRPFDGICHDDMKPITKLFREAIDQRAHNRIRFGAV